MFWANIYALSPQIEALLNKEDVTLQELMDQEEIVPECKSQNKKLVEYLTRPEIIEELVALTTKEPPEDIEERWRYKYPNVACELLTCNVPTLNEKLAGSETLLAKLYSFIDTDEPLNPLLASFFSKIIGVLLIRKSDQNWYSYQFMCLQVLEFLKGRQKCVDRLLEHLETSAIMDLVLKLVTKVEGVDMRQNILNWLDTQQLIQRLIKLLSSESNSEKHTNAAQLLCDIIKLAREYRLTCTERTDPDPILNTLESEETVSLILETILSGEHKESSIVGGIQVLLVLLGQESNNILIDPKMQGNNPGEEVTDNVDRIKIQNATLPYLEKLQQLLLNPPSKPGVKTTVGLLEIPLGNTRLHIAKLLTALLSSENIKVFRKLAELGTFQTLLDLFFKYSWNNFLHTQVDQCLALVISGEWQEKSNLVYTHIFVQCKLIDRILDAWVINDDKQKKENGIRQGYMGHLINIANNIVKKAEKSEDFDRFLKDNIPAESLHKWEALVNTQLAEINKTHQIFLGGKTQPYITSSEDSTEDFNSYSQDNYIQQVYENYQEQKMTSRFATNYGLYDDEFNEGNDALQPSNSVDQITTMPFTLTEEDLIKQEDAFNKICQQKQKAGLEEDGLEWGDEGELTFQTVIDKRDWPFKQQQHDSISSDEDEETKDIQMEIDSADPWDTPEPLSSNTILPEVNPWDSSTSPTDESSGWANFDNFDSSLHIASMNVLQSAFVPSAVVAEADNKQQVPETTTSTTDKDTTSTSAVPTSPSSSPSPSSSDIKPVEPSAADDKITAANINEEQNTIISNTIKEISNPESNVSSINVNDNANVEPIENITPSNRKPDEPEDKSRALTTL
ncbi:serine/threonine-protein phosphatase 6 regulatory subunit 3 isoform X1 [Microplitis demolitor]|uniref:serine/threonine-protein phosphatase 6 regulatory subunit 3 isoform X1 n=1 Tax=Microplitis demolitor TaxID=69319 RepID=UPI00043FFEA8|nr:serine/threonine-protein phosphatase 6 regulatory subunit 3 isoform X1 [Microplitis demolitor]XP_014298865.1 serine/threonine-protein phosphatase 6 regulatory subunit 3 isoform X1 [Microplitis demolitor]XP_053595831.1 serine/threonine-protein phosphatase 6 regulatory subunit 3 isoform X1 [Microplitis demolitor]XP_053595832.1 serine/threonine-protein phosphatase 6 regulatory subunit 3 isoform X1 [Microplitis demolitor]